MRSYTYGFSAVALLSLGLTSTAWAAPTPTVCTTTTATSMVTVTPETSRQSASLTAGLISDRIGSVVSGLSTATSSTVLNAGCGEAFAQRLAGAPGPVAADGDQLALSPGEGEAAPATKHHNGVWSGGSLTRVKKTDVGGEYAGNIVNGVFGYDRVLAPNLIAGLALGIENVDIQTHYNDGSVESLSYSFAPYVGYAFNDWLTLDGTIGHTWIDYDFTRDTATTGTTDASRWFGSAGLTATERFERGEIYGGLGYLRLYERQDGFIESDQTVVEKSTINFGQARLTVGGNYVFPTSFGAIRPNGFFRFEYDAPHAKTVALGTDLVSSDDRSGFMLGLGTDVIIGDDLLVSLAGTTALGRTNTSSRSISANLRYSF